MIWRYFTRLSSIQPLLDGNDLKNLGYKPGPIYKQILDRLVEATLDGIVITCDDAIEFIGKQYSIDKC
jgi:tRNA nucleotidyltransferase (CCA-adding enzyme)